MGILMMSYPTRATLWMLAWSIACAACGSGSPVRPTEPAGVPTSQAISSDAELFTLITQTQPFQSYTRFPSLDLSPTGTLPASSAHQPIIRVGLNATAASALQSGRLPAGSSFPDGSIIVKEVLGSNGLVNLYAVMYKDSRNPLAGSGWLWAELRPAGSADYSVRNRGAACTSCHGLDQGPHNDRVRIFERQR